MIKFYIFSHFNIKEMLENLYKIKKKRMKEMIVKMKDLITCFFFIIMIGLKCL